MTYESDLWPGQGHSLQGRPQRNHLYSRAGRGSYGLTLVFVQVVANDRSRLTPLIEFHSWTTAMPGELEVGEVQSVSVPVADIPVSKKKNAARILSILVTLIPLQTCRAPQEEKILEAKFGEEYRRYRAIPEAVVSEL